MMEERKAMSDEAMKGTEKMDKALENRVGVGVTLMLHPDLVDWLKSKGPEWRSMIVQILLTEWHREAISVNDEDPVWQKTMQEITTK